MMNLSFTQLNIGCLSRNRYWGEPEDQAFRKAKCTSTLISGPEGFLLVDPGVPREEMEQLLDERSKVSVHEIRAIFFTHLHGDHRVDALSYPGASPALPAGGRPQGAFPRRRSRSPAGAYRRVYRAGFRSSGGAGFNRRRRGDDPGFFPARNRLF